MFSHYVIRKISPICKISTFSEELSFLNPRRHLKQLSCSIFLLLGFNFSCLTVKKVITPSAAGTSQDEKALDRKGIKKKKKCRACRSFKISHHMPHGEFQTQHASSMAGCP